MELREAIEDAQAKNDEKALAAHRALAQREADRESATLASALSEQRLDAARVAALRLRYWQRALDALNGDDPLD